MFFTNCGKTQTEGIVIIMVQQPYCITGQMTCPVVWTYPPGGKISDLKALYYSYYNRFNMHVAN